MSNTAPTRRLVILVVEDIPDCAVSMAMLLQHFGHETYVAPSGAEALRLAQLHPLDVVFLDLALPGMHGYEVAGKLRSMLAKQPIIAALTGYGDDSTLQRSQSEGFDRHFIKPLHPSELAKYLQECIAKLPE
jgi:CheY-like chemotaxis protein